MSLAANLWEALKDKAFRNHFADVMLDRMLAKQIRENRRARGWTQRELARRSGLSLATIVRYEVHCGNAQIRKLQRIASAFDCALVIRFAAWSECLVIWGEGACVVPSYADDVLLQEMREAPPSPTPEADKPQAGTA